MRAEFRRCGRPRAGASETHLYIYEGGETHIYGGEKGVYMGGYIYMTRLLCLYPPPAECPWGTLQPVTASLIPV